MRAGRRFVLAGASVDYPGCAALRGIDLTIEPGERVAFVGPSGAGKTTLLRLLNGTVRPTAGRVEVDGQALGALPEPELRRLRASIGFVHQDLALIPNVRVVQNVVTGRIGSQSLLGTLRELLWTRRATLERVHELLERVGIGEKMFVRTDRLSGGQRQRVAIARALFQEPAAILADEPVSSVDPTRARDTVELLNSLSRDLDLTLCVSLHDIGLARAHFPRLVGMRGGRIVFDVKGADLDAEAFESLYALSRAELLADGA